jgi:hypothetical protein
MAGGGSPETYRRNAVVVWRMIGNACFDRGRGRADHGEPADRVPDPGDPISVDVTGERSAGGLVGSSHQIEVCSRLVIEVLMSPGLRRGGRAW